MIINFSSIQINCKLGRITENVKNAEKFLLNLPEFEKHIVLLPELWTSGFTENLSYAHNANLDIIEYLKKIAKLKNLVIAGSFIIEEDNNFFNQLVVINSNGIELAKYNKNHLFPQMNEKKYYSPGKTLTTINIWGVKIGLAICYDLRFPELIRNYAALGNEICLLPAQWPTKRIEHFNVLLKARSIENQMIILATNTCGKTENTDFGGNSSLIDQSGKNVFKLHNKEQTDTRSINLESLFELRLNFPVLQDASIDITKEIIHYRF